MQAPAPIRRRPAAGFTLVEMLVVIVVIGILAAMLSGAVVAARLTAKRARDKMEVAQLAIAVEKYKQDYGEYPPDLTFINHNMADAADPIRTQARNDLMRHVRKRWPRYTPTPIQLIAGLASVGLAQAPASPSDDPMTLRIYLDPASALAFWLGGIPESATRVVPSGFHADPSNPFQFGSPRTDRLFEFDETRFIWRENDPYAASSYRAMRYYPPSAKMPSGSGGIYTVNEFAPYVYFKARRVGHAGNRYEYGYSDGLSTPTMFVPAFYMHGSAANANTAVPYLDAFPGPAPYWDEDVDDPTDATIVPAPSSSDSSNSGLASLDYVRRWRNLESVQILCPGLDGQYGDIAVDPTTGVGTYRFRFSRSRGNFRDNDLDNMGNFSEGRLEDETQ